MDEAEAEAALLALGPKLEWKERKYHRVVTCWESQNLGPGNTRDIFCGLGDAFYYDIEIAPMDESEPWEGYKTRMVHLHDDDRTDCASATYNSLIRAKAACERHHATGKWD